MATTTKEQKKTKKPTALKRVLQNNKKNLRNKSFKAKLRTATRSLKTARLKKEPSETIQSKLTAVYSLVDLATKKGLYKTGKAAKIKSRLTLAK